MASGSPVSYLTIEIAQTYRNRSALTPGISSTAVEDAGAAWPAPALPRDREVVYPWNRFDRALTTRHQRPSRKYRRAGSPLVPLIDDSFSPLPSVRRHAIRQSARFYCHCWLWGSVAGARLLWHPPTLLPGSRPLQYNPQSTCGIRACATPQFRSGWSRPRVAAF